MTIDEAIKEIEKAISFAHFTHPSRTEEALKLGIEALKRLQQGRAGGFPYFNLPLPGETKD